MAARPDPHGSIGPLTWTPIGHAEGAGEVAAAIERDIPPFLAEVTATQRSQLAERLPQLQWVVAEDELPVAVVRAVPVRWSGRRDDAPAGGAAEALGRAGEVGADTLAVLDIVVAFGARGRGVGASLLGHLDEQRRIAGFDRLLLLARPHAKQDYPLIPFARYLSFVDAMGRPFDPWLRAAWRLGFVPVRGVERSLIARVDLAAIERWTGRAIPGSGPYLVPGAIKPVILETERDEGRYREPHLWVAPRDGVAEPTPDGWVTSLGVADVVAGDRAHREVRRTR